MAGEGIRPRRMIAAWLVGLVWSQAAAAVALLWLPARVELLRSGLADTWVTVARWTMLLPVTLAESVTRAEATPHQSLFARLLVADVLATLVVLAFVWGLMAVDRPWRDVCLLVLAAAVLASGFGGWLRIDRARRAEAEFFALLAHTDVPWRDAAIVTAAEKFAADHPESRWVGEAVRISAMSHTGAERWSEAAAAWRRFDAQFAGTGLPGEAYADYRLGQCAESLGRDDVAATHYRAALAVLAARTDGIQQWIAADSARRLGRLESRQGLVALAGYWNTRSRVLGVARSNE